MRVDHSQAPKAFANGHRVVPGLYQPGTRPVEKHRRAYRRDLDQAAQFLHRRGAADWRGVFRRRRRPNGRIPSGASATRRRASRANSRRCGCWRAISCGKKLRDDEFTALLAGPKLARKIPGTPQRVRDCGGFSRPRPAAIAALRDRALLELFYSSGIRVSELAGLMLQQVDLEIISSVSSARARRSAWCRSAARRAMRSGRIWLPAGPHLVKPKTGSQFFLNNRGAALSRVMLWMLVKKYAQRARYHEERETAWPAPFVRDASPHRRRRSAGDSGNAGAREYRDDADLYGRRTPATG